MTERRLFPAVPAGQAPAGGLDMAVQLTKTGQAQAACLPVTVDPNNGDPPVTVPPGGSYTCPACPPVEANLWPFLDNFTDTDGIYLEQHVSDSGHTWVGRQSFGVEVFIEDNTLKGVGFFDTFLMASCMPPSPEYDLTAVFIMPTDVGVNDNQAGMVARYTAAPGGYERGYFLEISTNFGDNNFLAELWLIDAANGWTSLGSWTTTIVDDQSLTVLFECRNASKKVYVDGTERISSNDNTVTDSGRIELFMATDSTEIRCNSFSAISP